MKTVFNRNSTQPDGLGGSRALINPWDVLKPVPGFPQTCVSTFSAKIIQSLAFIFHWSVRLPVFADWRR